MKAKERLKGTKQTGQIQQSRLDSLLQEKKKAINDIIGTIPDKLGQI